MTPKITIGVSSCLLGHKIRYDGKDKYNAVIDKEICERFVCMPFCPEYAIGLGVPRDPIQLVKIERDIRALGVNNKNQDVTQPLVEYAEFVCHTFSHLRGYIFKSQSPSCGLSSTPVFNAKGEQINFTNGIFAQQLLFSLLKLPVIDEIQLEDKNARLDFFRSVELYNGPNV